jgi:hypothetical protein
MSVERDEVKRIGLLAMHDLILRLGRSDIHNPFEEGTVRSAIDPNIHNALNPVQHIHSYSDYVKYLPPLYLVCTRFFQDTKMNPGGSLESQ